MNEKKNQIEPERAQKSDIMTFIPRSSYKRKGKCALTF